MFRVAKTSESRFHRSDLCKYSSKIGRQKIYNTFFPIRQWSSLINANFFDLWDKDLQQSHNCLQGQFALPGFNPITCCNPSFLTSFGSFTDNVISFFFCHWSNLRCSSQACLYTSTSVISCNSTINQELSFDESDATIRRQDCNNWSANAAVF